MAGAGGYQVVISAKDAASGTFDAMTKRFDNLTKRMQAAGAPAKRFGDSLERLTKASGVDQIATGFKNIGIAATETFRSLSRVIEPLSAITGAASLAGIYKLTDAFAQFGNTLNNQAQRAGVSTDSLYRLQNAARLVGIDAATLTNGLTTLNDNMRSAAVGGAPQFLIVMRNLGLHLDELNKMNPEQRIRAIADALNTKVQNPADKALYASTLFGGDGLLPFLRQGADGIDHLVKEGQKLSGAFPSAYFEHAREFSKAQAGLIISVQGLGYAVGNVLGPVFAPLLDDMSSVVEWMHDWVDANQNWIRTEIVTWLKRVDWIGLGRWIGDIATQADHVAQALGGWENVGKGVLAFFATRWLIGMLAPFVTLGFAVGRLTWAVGSGLVGAFKAAEVAAAAFNRSTMALPVFRVLAATLGVLDSLSAGRLLSDLPPDSPLQRLNPDGQDGGGQGEGGLGGWWRRHAPTWLGGAPTGPVQTVPMAPGQQSKNAASMGDIFQHEGGFTREWAAALLGSGIQESGLDPSRLGPGGHQGIFQWSAERRAAIEAQFHKPVTQMTPEEQARAAIWEIDNRPEFAGLSTMARQDHNLGRANYFVTHNFEAPGNYAAEEPRRLALSQGALAGLGPAPSPSVPDVHIQVPSTQPSAPAAPLPSSSPIAGQPGANGRVQMNVRISGAPAVVTSRTSGDIDLTTVTPGLLAQ